VQFTPLQALAFKGEEYQFNSYKLENTTFFLLARIPVFLFQPDFYTATQSCASLPEELELSPLVFLK